MIKFSRNILKFITQPNFARSVRVISSDIGHITINNHINTDDLIEQIEYDAFFYERTPNKSRTISKLQELFDCTTNNAEEIIKNVPDLTKRSVYNISESVKLCDKKLISNNTLYENPWILGIKNDELEQKFVYLEKIKPRDYEDVVPFLQLSVAQLAHLTNIMISESPNVPGGNRLYYFQELTKVEPRIIAKYFVVRPFIYEVHFLFFRNILKFLIENGVTPMNILRDLWVFKYHPNKVRQRITIARKAKSKRIMPWMVRCKESVFTRYLDRTKEAQILLANRPLEDYLAEKLECDPDMAKYIATSHSSIKKIHITKVKDTLNYLLEEGFTAYHIAQVPRILCHSLKTTRSRIQELRSLGHNPQSLIALCKSKKEFEKYVNIIRIRMHQDDAINLK